MLARTKKTLLIAMLTTLIWVWADLSGDNTLSNKRATLRVSPGLTRDVLVTINGSDAVEIFLDIKGPASRIEELKRDNEPLEVFFSPPEEMDKQEYQYPVMSLLQRYDKLNKVGLTVEQCKPATVEVRVERLVTKQVKVLCVNEHNLIEDNVNIEPAFIDMPVRSFWSGDRLTAFVKLSPSQISQLGTKPVTATPYVEVDTKRFIYSDKPVVVTGSKESSAKVAHALPGPRIGFIVNQNIEDKYNVNITEKSDSLNTLQYMATEIASEAYKKSAYHILIEIQESDIRPDTDGKPLPITKDVIYNFPSESIRKGEIEPLRDRTLPTVTLQLIPKS